MTTSKEILQLIDNLPPGEPFTANTFRHLGKTDNIRKILSRLVKSGDITRVAHGIYCKPHYVPLVGDSLPSLREIARTITDSTGETILIHGAEAARRLELTTQVPLRLIFYTNGNSRDISIGNRKVTLKHVNPSQLICAHSIAGIVISALKYLGREHVTAATIKHIENCLTADDFNEVLKNTKHMPAWMADLFYVYKKEQQSNE